MNAYDYIDLGTMLVEDGDLSTDARWMGYYFINYARERVSDRCPDLHRICADMRLTEKEAEEATTLLATRGYIEREHGAWNSGVDTLQRPDQVIAYRIKHGLEKGIQG